MLSSATATQVQLVVPDEDFHNTTPHGRLLYAKVHEDSNFGHPRNSEPGSGTLNAALYALNMELTSGMVRNDGGSALFGVHFAHLVPENITNLVRVELEDGRVLPSEDSSIFRVPGNAQGHVVETKLPSNYSGRVRLLGSVHL